MRNVENSKKREFTEEELFWKGVISLCPIELCKAVFEKEVVIDEDLNVREYTGNFYERMIKLGREKSCFT